VETRIARFLRLLDFEFWVQDGRRVERGFEIITKEALELTPTQRIELAEILLASADAGDGCQEAWDEEIHARVRAIDQVQEVGGGLRR